MDLAVMCQDFNLCATAASRDPYHWTIRHLHYNHAELSLFHAHVAGAGHTEVRGCMYSYSRRNQFALTEDCTTTSSTSSLPPGSGRRITPVSNS